MSIIIRDNELSEETRKLIYKKQCDLKLEKKHSVSLGKTINQLLKDAYLKDSKPKTLTP